MSLKAKTVTGLFWNSIANFSQMGIEFGIGIILARLLTPQEFGLIGMITVFIVISEIFINSGFSQALIRKQNCTQKDYSTAFYFNLAIGVLFFILLYFAAPIISNFFEESQLISLIQVLGVVLIISSLTIIQRTILIKRVDFKLQTYISVTSSILSGTIAVVMAFIGFGVWSLVVKTLSRETINSILFWSWNKWKPDWIFSMTSFKNLFGFGSKLLASGLLVTVFNNIYYLVIGKFFSAQTLGFYTRAELFKNLPSNNLAGIITGVGYPVLAKLQDDPVKLKAGFKRLLISTAFLTFLSMLGLAAISESLIITLVGEQWRPSIIYLQLLSFIGLMHPLNSININLLNVMGRSDLYLKLQIIMQILTFPVVGIGICFGIKSMILGMIVNGIIGYFLFSRFSAMFTNYSTIDQLKDLMPSFIIATIMGSIVYFIGETIHFVPAIVLLIQIVIGVFISFFICELFKLKEYLYIKEIVLKKLEDSNNIFK